MSPDKNKLEEIKQTEEALKQAEALALVNLDLAIDEGMTQEDLALSGINIFTEEQIKQTMNKKGIATIEQTTEFERIMNRARELDLKIKALEEEIQKDLEKKPTNLQGSSKIEDKDNKENSEEIEKIYNLFKKDTNQRAANMEREISRYLVDNYPKVEYIDRKLAASFVDIKNKPENERSAIEKSIYDEVIRILTVPQYSPDQLAYMNMQDKRWKTIPPFGEISDEESKALNSKISEELRMIKDKDPNTPAELLEEYNNNIEEYKKNPPQSGKPLISLDELLNNEIVKNRENNISELEIKKVDIEKRRKEDIEQSFFLSDMGDKERGKFLKDPEGYFNEHISQINKILSKDPDADYTTSYYDSQLVKLKGINDKYDAEIAALETPVQAKPTSIDQSIKIEAPKTAEEYMKALNENENFFHSEDAKYANSLNFDDRNKFKNIPTKDEAIKEMVRAFEKAHEGSIELEAPEPPYEEKRYHKAANADGFTSIDARQKSNGEQIFEFLIQPGGKKAYLGISKDPKVQAYAAVADYRYYLRDGVVKSPRVSDDALRDIRDGKKRIIVTDYGELELEGYNWRIVKPVEIKVVDN